VAWRVSAVPLPGGDGPVELWVDADGQRVAGPLPDAERLPGAYVLPGLVDAHAHPAIGNGQPGTHARDPAEAVAALAEWAAAGVGLVRDVGSPGGLTLRLDLGPGLPEVQAAGRFLAPPGRYFPGLLLDGVPQARLNAAALAELDRGARWVKVIADFPLLDGDRPTSAPQPNYSRDAVADLARVVHAAGGRVAAHTTLDDVASLVRAGVDSIEHGTEMDHTAVRLMARHGTAWTPTLSAALHLGPDAPDRARRRVAEQRDRFTELLPLAHRLGVPVLAGTDTAGTLAGEIALLARHGLEPVDALAAATTTAHRYLGVDTGQTGRPATLVTYDHDPREDLTQLANPRAVIINGTRIR
jgi:imidazolonepropionase-like amidohydrolase